MERLSIDELIAHCDRQLERLPNGNIMYQEHESVRAYLQILRHYVDTGTVDEFRAALRRTAEDDKAREEGRKTAYDENGTPYLIEAEWSEAKHIIELLAAEAQGQLVVLPCKVGDTLYTESHVRGLTKAFEAPDLAWIVENLSLFGKTVFLTCQELEAALGGGEGEA